MGKTWRVLVRLVLGAAALAAAGCASGGAKATAAAGTGAVQELAGFYESGPGASWFQRCGAPAGEPTWWVTFTGESVAQADAARRDGRLVAGQKQFLRVRAVVTTDGQVGPRGKGFPALLVREVLEVRPAADGDCASALTAR